MPRVYALSIDRPTPREKASEKANDRFTSQLRGRSPRITCYGAGHKNVCLVVGTRLKANKLENDVVFLNMSI